MASREVGATLSPSHASRAPSSPTRSVSRRSSSLRQAVEGVAQRLCPLARSSAVKVGAAHGAHRSEGIDGDGGAGIVLEWENAGSSRLVGGCLTFSQRQSRPNEEPGICLLNSQPIVPFHLIIFIRCFPSSFCGCRWRWAGASAGCVRLCTRTCSLVGVPDRVPGPEHIVYIVSLIPVTGKKSRNVEDRSGASLNSSSIFANLQPRPTTSGISMGWEYEEKERDKRYLH
ncbi:hypothetical protein EDB86DRAFT_576885 [Lactarius hatsudake]|nr:hypothetical protein EDB86DRAFT_576885 [Lactarius hatsudake]